MAAGRSASWGAPIDRAAVVRERWVLAAVVVAAAALRLHWIGFASLDIDEGFTVWIARHPASEIWSLLARLDDHAPLYYLALSAWIKVAGDSVVALRLPSVVCGVLTVVCAYACGRIVGGPGVGLLAAAFVACAPDLVRWSQEARMYAPVTLAIAVAVAAFAAALSADGPHPAAWSLYALGVAAGVWIDYSALLCPVAATAALAGTYPAVGPSRRRALVRNWALAHLAIAALCAPVAILLVRQVALGTVVNWYPVNPTAPLATAAVAAGMLLAGRRIWPSRPDRTAFVVGLWAVPIVCLMVISLRHPIFEPRAYLWTNLPLFVAAAAVVLAVRARAVRYGLAAAVAAVNLAGVAAHYRNDLAGDVLRRWDQAAAYVAARARPGDVILIYVPYVQPVFDYYFGPAPAGVEEHAVPAGIGATASLFPPLGVNDGAAVRALAAAHRRVWFVHGMYPSAQVILDALQVHGRLADSRTVTDALHIYLYATPGGAASGSPARPQARAP